VHAFSDQPLGIDPVAAAGSDPSLRVEWRPVQLGTQRSLGCSIGTASEQAMTVVVEQRAYRKTLSGNGSVDLTAIPVAPAGTAGTLTVSDASGATIAQYGWIWQPPGAKTRPALQALQTKSATALQPKNAAAPQTPLAEKAKSAQRSATGAAATTFFGQVAQGQRFAFILDMSGSMTGARWAACQRELAAALRALSGQAEFFVVLFSERFSDSKLLDTSTLTVGSGPSSLVMTCSPGSRRTEKAGATASGRWASAAEASLYRTMQAAVIDPLIDPFTDPPSMGRLAAALTGGGGNGRFW